MNSPTNRVIFQSYAARSRLELSVWTGAGLGMAYSFTIPYRECHPVFLLSAMIWTFAAATQLLPLVLAPSKYVYSISMNWQMGTFDPCMAVLGWFSFYASKVGL